MRPIRRSFRASRRLGRVLPILLLALCAPGVFAQSPATAGVSPGYGTSNPILYHIGFAELTPEQSTYDYTTVTQFGFQGKYSFGMPASFLAHPHIPSGALITSLELDSCDTNISDHHVTAELTYCDSLGANCVLLGNITSASAAVGTGCVAQTVDLTSQSFTLHNNAQQLLLRVTETAGNPTNLILGASIGYKLQVSPGPGVATFTDVPTSSPQFKFVEALVAAGITAGCGGGNYCPNSPITRGQMAVFLATALGLHFPN